MVYVIKYSPRNVMGVYNFRLLHVFHIITYSSGYKMIFFRIFIFRSALSLQYMSGIFPYLFLHSGARTLGRNSTRLAFSSKDNQQ